MKESFTRYNYRDFIQRYVETFGWLIKDDGDKRFVFLTRADETRLYYTADNNHKTEYYALRDKGQAFEFIPVKMGWFNSDDDGAFFLTRVPARQWKRGISVSNTNIFKLIDGRLAGMSLTYANLNNIFNNNFTKNNYPDDLKIGALSKHFMLDSAYRLWFYDKIIGSYQPKEGFILDNDIVAQELRDLIHRKDWNINVSNHI